VPSYTVGYIDVYRNGVRLVSTDFTATTGTTVVLANACTVGDAVVTESFLVSSVLNAIPATAGSVSDSYIVDVSASKLTGSRTIPKGTMPAGAVLQVVQGVSTTSTTISAGPTDTTLTATITPSNATSKILVIVNQFVYLYGGGGDSGFVIFILKNGSVVYNNSGNSLYIGSSSGSPEVVINYPITYLDSPATTSALTYKTQATATSGATPTFQQYSNQSTITLMEIAA
jgi:hypothetical protein